METTIQPILCCVGADVAGEPTQFLMERACGASHLDWRVITVEVSAEELQAAWNGMSVMRFRAARFFRSHQAAAMSLVASASPLDTFIGGITSALRVGDVWTMWHNSGPARVQALSNRCRWSQAICWLHGDSVRERSIFGACLQSPPRELIWTGFTGDIPAEWQTSANLTLIQDQSDAEVAAAITERLAEERADTSLIHFGDLDMKQLDLLTSCQPGCACNLLVISQSPGSRRKLVEHWRAGEVHVLTQTDIVVAEEGYDQARWIGCPANFDLLREAYEEYADF